MKTQQMPKSKGTFGRLMKLLFGFFPKLLPLIIFMIVVNAILGALPSIFQQNVIAGAGLRPLRR